VPISRRLFVLGLLPGGALAQGLRLQPRALRFPRDHGAHPEWRTEWWYLTQSTELKLRACKPVMDEAWCGRGFWAWIDPGCAVSSGARV